MGCSDEEIREAIERDGYFADRYVYMLKEMLQETMEQRDDLQKRLDAVKELLDEGYYAESLAYDFQAVNQAHRVAAGGPLPMEAHEIQRATDTKYTQNDDSVPETTDKE